MRFHSHLHTAVSIVEKYKGQEPMAAFLKKFFAADKKYGSGDRKSIAALCYAYYRLGKITTNDSTEERIIKAVFLCNNKPAAFLDTLRPGWNDHIHLPVKEKWIFCEMDANIAAIFPWADELSNGIDAGLFNLSFLQQPDLFLRIRPGGKNKVEEKLSASGITYQRINNKALALPNSSKVDAILNLNKDAVVQDLNSQAVLDQLLLHTGELPSPVRTWDCCAASGGKSILLHDVLAQKISLSVSDIRQSILANLTNRFTSAGIRNYRSFTADLTDKSDMPQGEKYDLIICDAPCTGSGTWARTPEQLYFFDPVTTDDFSALQKRISGNVISCLSAGGFLVYITCSAFRAENEEVVTAILAADASLELVDSRVLPGYAQQADTMFTALFKKKG